MESAELANPATGDDEARPSEEPTMTTFITEVDSYRHLKRGDVIEGTVVRVGAAEVMVDIGAKTEAIMRIQDPASDSLVTGLKSGEKILVYVAVPENREGNAIVSLARAHAERDWRLAQQLHEEGTAFDGEVIGFNKGGLIVRFGEVRGFVPASQVVELRAGDRDQLEARLGKMLGRKLKLKVIELDRARNRLILSEKAAQREWRSEMRDRLLTELQEGEIRHGRVTSVCDFGVFVDLGGIDGLAHISELAWRSVGHPSEVLEVGAEVDVLVLGVDREKRRVALSIKRTKPEPWQDAASQLTAGQTVSATITKLVTFGAFARVAEGLEGLIHISELSDERIAHPKQVVQVGDTVLVRVLNLESSRRRLSLSLKQANQADGPAQVAEPQAGEAQAGEAQLVELQVAEPQAGEAHVPEPQEAETQVADLQAGEAHVPPPQVAADQTAEPRVVEPQAVEPQVAEPEPEIPAGDQ